MLKQVVSDPMVPLSPKPSSCTMDAGAHVPRIVTLNLFQGPCCLACPEFAARWMLKQVQHDAGLNSLGLQHYREEGTTLNS